MNQHNREKRLSRLERESLENLHKLDEETGGQVDDWANLEKALAFMAAGKAAEQYRTATGEPELPPEAQALIGDFLEQARDRADLLRDAASVERRMTDRGARGLYGHQRVQANVDVQRQKWSNRKFSQGDYQAAVDRVHRENPSLGWNRIKSIVAAELGVTERTVHNNVKNPHAKG